MSADSPRWTSAAVVYAVRRACFAGNAARSPGMTLTCLDDVSCHDLAACHGFGALVGLDGSVWVVRSEGEGDLVAGLADLGDGLLSGVCVAGSEAGVGTAAESGAEQAPGGRVVVLADVLEVG